MNKAMRALPRLTLGLVLAALPWCGLFAQKLPHWHELTGDVFAAAVLDSDDVDFRISYWLNLLRVAECSLDAMSLSANDVGGYFCQNTLAKDGSLFVLTRNAGGKSLRTEGEDFAMRARSLFLANDRVMLDYALHFAPCVHRRAIKLEVGLQLGVLPVAVFYELASRGNQSTFVFDALVDAENVHGELFGFDRTREISTMSAQEIADAAKAWGQNDDITMVALRRQL